MKWLALLVLNVGRPLSSDSIVDALWGEQPPPTAPEMVRNCIARARKRMGEDAIETHPGGYQLRVDPDSVDWLRFERLAAEGSRALERREPKAALARFEEALSVWRGRPLPELDDVHAAQGAVERLEELRLTVVEDRNDAELELGRSSTLVADLEQLVREHPYRERPLGQLMLALYRCGRQKEALERYQTGRRLLVDEAGLEPSPRLQQLNVSILLQDAGLDLPRGLIDSAGTVTPGQTRRRRISLPVVAAAVAVATAAIVVPLLTLGGSAPVELSARSLAVLDARSGATVGSLRLSGSPGPLAVAPKTVWIGQRDPASLVEVRSDLKIERTVALSAAPYSVASGERRRGSGTRSSEL
jgi:DNA-binding SARP family transcriptional activator